MDDYDLTKESWNLYVRDQQLISFDSEKVIAG